MKNNNEFDTGYIVKGITNGIIIAALMVGTMVFFVKSAAYPPGSELYNDYAGAGLVFSLVYSYAIWRLKPAFAEFFINILAFTMFGLIASGLCASGCQVSTTAFVVPGRVFGPFLIAAIVWAVVAAVTSWAYEKFIDSLDRKPEEVSSKQKNDYLPHNRLVAKVEPSNLPTYLLSLSDEELNAMVGE